MSPTAVYPIAIMKIKNIDGMSAADLQREAEKGARFVYYSYTLSFIIVTLRKTSGVYLIKAGENAVQRGFRFTLLSLLFGWWGIPFGPKFTLQSIRVNRKGGNDVTDEVMSTVAGHILFQESQRQQKKVTA